MVKILVSSCLLGEMVRYHGKDARCINSIIEKWKYENRIISICPEVSAGLPTPRTSCEIVKGNGNDVLTGQAQVISHNGINRTKEFILGAYNTLQAIKSNNIKVAILKSRSPSCGNNEIYDGTYSGKLIEGTGVTASLLKKNGVKIFNENELEEADEYVRYLEHNLE